MPQPRSLYASPPKTSKTPSCILTFLGGGCMMLKGHQSSSHGSVSEEGKRRVERRGPPREPACACVCVSERAWQCYSLQSAFSGAAPRGGGGALAALQSLVFE